MSKVVSLCFTFILLVSLLSFTAARLRHTDQVLQNQQHRVNMDTSKAEIRDEINCEMLEKDECLFRRSLAAHLDYIYTQEQPPGSP